MLETIISSRIEAVIVFAILGLMIGSFLNVVIHRKPKIMEQVWREECSEIMNIPEQGNISERYTLSTPSSTCPACGHQIRWYENIPVLSYLFLRGKCSSCHSKISLRYPLVELTIAVVFGWIAYQYGAGLKTGFWCFYSALLVSLALIDWDTQLLPDDMNYILLWAGLMGSVMGVTGVVPVDAILGAFFGYSSLWLIVAIFYLLTKKQGMGNGDFKLFAALGAWFGWQFLVQIILIASIVGAVIGILMKVSRREGMDVPIPFGPFLAGAGMVMLVMDSHPLMKLF